MKKVKYKVGDIAVVVGNSMLHGFQIGDSVVVKEVYGDGDIYTAENDSTWFYLQNKDVEPTGMNVREAKP